MKERLQETLRIHRLDFSSEAGDFFNINLEVYQGEIHGLVMANPQFKNPFYDLFTGNAVPASGSIYIDNKDLGGVALKRALHEAVYAVGLKSGLISSLTLAENLFLVERGRPLFLPSGQANINEKAERLFREFDLETLYDPRGYPEELTPAGKHIVELLRAHIRKPRVIYMDNIALIYSKEERLLWERIVKKLAGEGRYAVLLTLNTAMEETATLPDRVSIIRNGTTVMHLSEKPFQILQPGRERVFGNRTAFDGDEKRGTLLFSVRRLSGGGRLKDVNFDLYQRETLGIFNPDVLEGQELAEILLSRLQCSGTALFEGEEKGFSCQMFPKLEIGMIPYGENMLFYNCSLFHNVTLRVPERVKRGNILARKRVTRFLYENVMKAVHSRELLEEYGELKRLPKGRVTKEQSMHIQVARWLFYKAKILVMTSPESFYDSVNIHKFIQLLEDIRGQGASVIIFSENPEFLQKCSGRILELRNGRMEEGTEAFGREPML